MRRSSMTGQSFSGRNSELTLRPDSAADVQSVVPSNGITWGNIEEEKPASRWPVTDENGPLPRIGYPTYRKQSFALPYTNSLTGSDDSREELHKHTTTTTTTKTVTISQNKLRLLILLIAVLVIMGIVLTGIAIGLSMRSDDNSKVTYYTKVKLDKGFQPDMANVKSYAFRRMELDVCRMSRDVYEAALRACSLDDLRSGSVDVFATYVFSKTELDHLVRTSGKIPSVAGSERALQNILQKASSSQPLLVGADVFHVRKQPETMSFNMRTEHEDMMWTAALGDPSSGEYNRKKIEYCHAVQQAFGDSYRGCRVNEFLTHEKQVDATIRVTSADIKDRGRALGMVTSPDKLNSVVRRILGNSKTDSAFFEGQKAAVKISVEHQLAEREVPTTTTPTVPVTEMGSFEEVTITTIIIHYNGSLDNSTTTSLLNGSDVTSGVTVTLSPNGTVYNNETTHNETTYNETTQSTTPYHQPMEGIGIDAGVTNVSSITVNVPLSGLVDAIDIIDKKMVFTANEDDEDLPWCDE